MLKISVHCIQRQMGTLQKQGTLLKTLISKAIVFYVGGFE